MKIKSAKKPKQYFLAKQFNKREFAFGGSLLKGNNPKRARPLDSKLPVHLILRSALAVGDLSMRKGARKHHIERIVRKTCAKYGVRIYQYANSGNHLHILLKLRKRFLWKPFICELTSKIAAAVVGLGKFGRKFWDSRPFTRLVSGWGRDYLLTKDYVALNILESLGILTREDRRWRQFLRTNMETGPPPEFFT